MLEAADVADRLYCRGAEFPQARRNGVGRGQDLCRLLVEQQMVITEMRTRHVPMEVLGFEIDREHVGQQCGEPDGDVGTVCAAWILAVGLGMHGHWGSSVGFVGSTPRNLVSPSSPARLIFVKSCHGVLRFPTRGQ